LVQRRRSKRKFNPFIDSTRPCHKPILIPLQFRNIPPSDLPSDITSSTRFTSVCINTALYLPYLTSRCLANGIIFRRANFPHLLTPHTNNIHPNGPVDLIVNCTGLSSHSLPGVEDKKVYPARGQIMLVRNTAEFMLDVSGTDEGNGEACYLMTRAAGGGTVLGGCYQKDNWNTDVDSELSKRIAKRCIETHPQLLKGENERWGGLSIVREGVGLRPVREGGTRVEREKKGDVWVVHNYGHGGTGYQSSYGCAEEAVKLVDEVLGEDSQGKAKL
jgi:D-amino-acid oxidase